MQHRHVETESVTHDYYNSSTIPKFYKNIAYITKTYWKILSAELYPRPHDLYAIQFKEVQI